MSLTCFSCQDSTTSNPRHCLDPEFFYVTEYLSFVSMLGVGSHVCLSESDAQALSLEPACLWELESLARPSLMVHRDHGLIGAFRLLSM